MTKFCNFSLLSISNSLFKALQFICPVLLIILFAGCSAGGGTSVEDKTSTNTISLPALQSIEVSPLNPSIAQGTTQQFSATGRYPDGSSQPLATGILWSSDNTTVATISSSGVATGLSTGIANITATSGGKSGSTQLTVTGIVLQSINVLPTNPIIAQAATQQFSATGTYSDLSTANLTATVTWNSDTTSVASIGSSGLATGVADGTSNITASSGLISASTILTVSSAVKTVTLTWTAPTTRMNGLAISSSEIDAYRIYYGTSSQIYTSLLEVAASSCCSTDITVANGLTYYFAVTALDNTTPTRLESDFSNEVTK